MTNDMFPWKFFPIDENIKKMMNQLKPGEIDKYTKEMIGKMMPTHLNSAMNQDDLLKGVFSGSNPNSSPTHPTLQYSVFETHEHVFVRVNIQNEKWLKKMKLYHTSNLMIIEHIPNHKDKHTITLPAIVKKKGAKANYRDDTLEIRINKSEDMQYSEIEVD